MRHQLVSQPGASAPTANGEWLAQKVVGIEAYNSDVAEHGGFGDTLRSF